MSWKHIDNILAEAVTNASWNKGQYIAQKVRRK